MATEQQQRSLAVVMDNEPLLADDKGPGVADLASGESEHMLRQSSSFTHTPSMKKHSIAFTSPIFYANETDGQVTIELFRKGPIEEPCSVTLETRDGSAVGGLAYVPLTTTVDFPSGTRSQELKIKLLETPWNATVEFQVHLINPQHCSVPKSFRMARVKLLDTSFFPADSFEESIKAGTLPTTSGFQLYWAYWKWNFATAKRSWVIMLTLLFGQIENAYALCMVYVNMYMVNVVCNTHINVEGMLLMPTREETAYVIAAMHIIPWIMLHILDLIRIRLDMKGHSERLLQTSIFRRFMNLSQESQKKVSFETLNWALTQEAPAVAKSFNAGLDVIEVCVNVSLNFAFVVLANPKAAPIVLLVPMLLLAWSFFRHFLFPPFTVKAETTAVSAHANEVYSKIDLVRTFFLRPIMNDGFEAKAGALQKTAVAMATNISNTQFGLTWIPHLITGLYIIIAIPRVLQGETKLGTMLAMITIIGRVGTSSLRAHTTIMGIVSSFPALRNVTAFLNKDTDLTNWKELSNKRADHIRDPSTPGFHMRFPIVVSDVGMQRGRRKIFWDINFEIDQGQLVAIHGPKRSGKNQFLRVLATQDFPTKGFVFSPSSAFALLVPRESLFLDRSLTDNLLLGLTNIDDSDFDRIKSILELCMLSHLIPIVNKDLQAISGHPMRHSLSMRSISAPGAEQRLSSSWRGLVSFTDLKLLAIARALLMAPEILLLECPFQFFDEEQTETVRGLLKRHIDEFGIFVNSNHGIANPRTVFYTTEDEKKARFADEIIEFIRPPGAGDVPDEVEGDMQPWIVKLKKVSPSQT